MQWCSGKFAVAILMGWCAATVRADENSESAPSSMQIALWIRQLDDPSFPVRESASRNLVQSGAAAIQPVSQASAGNSLELTVRSIRILGELASSADGKIARSAKEALNELAASDHAAAAVRARGLLWAQQQRIAADLQRSGARVLTKDRRVVAVNFDAAKSLVGILQLLHELPDLERLSFSTPLMNDAGLAELRGLPRLREINLYRSQIGDNGLKHLATFPSLQRVPMGETQVTDQGLAHLKVLTQLEYVGLRGNRVTDAGLIHLKDLTNLTGLYLGETKVTDAGLVHLQHLTKLKMLRLDQTAVSDAGLDHLKPLTDLIDVDVTDTGVTEAGAARLKDALPQVRIRRMRP